MDYAQSGVNIELGDDVSRILYEAAKLTWENRKGKLGEVIVPFDDFSGFRAIDISALPKGTFMNINFDGIGTKVELAERNGDHSTMAYDLFAMVCDDAVVRGAEPVLIGSILDVNSLGKKDAPHLSQVLQLAKGYIGAAKEANVAVVNGEVAELGSRVHGHGPFNYNWGAGLVWFGRKDRLFTGKEIKEGDFLVGLEEKGFRSNGMSLVRKVMEMSHGPDWHTIPWKEGNTTLGRMAATPSKIYSAAVVDMFGGYAGEPKADVHGVAHITGGGIPGKLGRVLKPSGLGAVIDSPMKPSDFVRYVQATGKVADAEAYRTWNMGQGMIVVTPKPHDVARVASNHGITAQVIGHVTKEPGIKIKNEGAYAFKGEKDLVF